MELPEIITLNEFGGDIKKYIAHMHNNVYRKDFYLEKIFFRGKPVHAVALPKLGDFDHSFVHATSDGKIESERTWNFRRSERIGWIKPIIEAADICDDIIVWQTVRRKKGKRKSGGKGAKTIVKYRIHIFHTKADFMICLNIEPKVWRFVSSYVANKQHAKAKYLREYAEFKKTGKAVEVEES